MLPVVVNATLRSCSRNADLMIQTDAVAADITTGCFDKKPYYYYFLSCVHGRTDRPG